MAPTSEQERTRDFDARENDESFRRLPPAMQARCIAVWARERDALSVGPEQRRRRTVRATRESAILLTLLLLFVNVFQVRSAGHALAIVLVGASVGAMVGALIGAGTTGRFRASMLGLLGFVAAQLSLMGHGRGGDMLALICLFFGAWLSSMSYGVYGLRLEDRARPGSGEI
jgi:hypothetical protein